MRNRYLFALVALAVVIAVAPSLATDGLDLIPGDAQGVLTIENLSRLYTTLGIVELRSEYPDKFGFLSTELIQDVGIDLLDPAALGAEGFDLDRPFHVGILTEPSAVVVLIPGEGRALKWVRAKMAEQGLQFTAEEKHGGVTIEADEADEVACFVRDSYVGIVVTNHEEGGGPALGTARDLIKGAGKNAMDSSERYDRAMSKLPDRADLRFYVGPELQSEISKWGTSEEQLLEHGVTADNVQSWYETMGIVDMVTGVSVVLDADRLTMDTYAWVGKDASIRNWLDIDADPVSFLRRLPSEPWLIGLGRVDLGALWRDIKPRLEEIPTQEGKPTIDEVLADVKEDAGVDLEADVINQIHGNIGLLINQASIMASDIVVLIQVADPDRIKTVVERFTALARDVRKKQSEANPERPPTQIVEEMTQGVKVYRVTIPPMVELCYGVIDDHFVATSTPLRFDEIAQGGPGFIDAAKNDEVRTGLSYPRGGVFYINFDQLASDAESVLPMMGPKGVTISQVLAELSEFVAVVRVDDEGMAETATLTSTRPGIWKHLIELYIAEMDGGGMD